ncbi:MAG: cytochrome C assembly family protein [Burkholderiales bacterium]
MPDIVIHVVASALYAGLALHFWLTRWRVQPERWRTTPAGDGAAPGALGLRAWERAAILVPLALNCALLYADLFDARELRFGFAQALSTMLCLSIAICWIEGLLYNIEKLYSMALAVAALCVPLPAFFSGRLAPDAFPLEFRLHLIAGMLAYSLFAVAMLHAVLISIVERQLHSNPGRVDRGLPPLLSMEALVFRLTGAAFAVLTLTFVVGAMYSESIFGRAMRFDHKTVFVVLSWIIFGWLLFGRWRYGWRGRTAFRWTLAGFLMLMLAYPGSRFVFEVILGRH